jgi:hypothetical protein
MCPPTFGQAISPVHASVVGSCHIAEKHCVYTPQQWTMRSTLPPATSRPERQTPRTSQSVLLLRFVDNGSKVGFRSIGPLDAETSSFRRFVLARVCSACANVCETRGVPGICSAGDWFKAVCIGGTRSGPRHLSPPASYGPFAGCLFATVATRFRLVLVSFRSLMRITLCSETASSPTRKPCHGARSPDS